MPISLSGNIADTPLVEIFEELATKMVTGTLILRMAKVEKSVFLKDGQIIFASSTDAQDRIGEMMVKAGKLSRENLEKALVMLKKTGGFKKLGALLVEQGFVAPKELFVALKTQVKEIIFSLFLQSEASYHFEETLPPDTIHLQLDIAELIREIIERLKQEA